MNNSHTPGNPKGENKKAFDHQKTVIKCFFFHFRLVMSQPLMKEHKSQYGITGNCYDLTIWLLDEFEKNGVKAFPIGHDLNTIDAHVAIVALDESGNRFLCDLGDQWINPILIDSKSEDFTYEKLNGFFPAAQIQVKSVGKLIEVTYHRPNGKVSRQFYDPEPINKDYFFKAAEYSQSLIKQKPLLECRTPYKNDIAHWEFYDWKSFLSTSEGLINEQSLNTVDEWSEKIKLKTGYNKQFLIEALEIYKAMAKLKY